MVSVQECLDREAHREEYEQIIVSGKEQSECTAGGKCSAASFRVYYCDKAKNVKTMHTKLSVVQQQDPLQERTTSVDQKNASKYEQVLAKISEFERLQRFELNSCSLVKTECHGSPVVYVNPANEPSVIGVYVGKTDQKEQYIVITFHGILKLLQGLVASYL